MGKRGICIADELSKKQIPRRCLLAQAKALPGMTIADFGALSRLQNWRGLAVRFGDAGRRSNLAQGLQVQTLKPGPAEKQKAELLTQSGPERSELRSRYICNT